MYMQPNPIWKHELEPNNSSIVGFDKIHPLL